VLFVELRDVAFIRRVKDNKKTVKMHKNEHSNINLSLHASWF
jgi:hypothetical protein